VRGLVGPNGRQANDIDVAVALHWAYRADGQSSLAGLPPGSGGRPVFAWMPSIAAKLPWPVTVETVIRFGRTPHLRAGAKAAARRQAADWTGAIEQIGLWTFS